MLWKKAKVLLRTVFEKTFWFSLALTKEVISSLCSGHLKPPKKAPTQKCVLMIQIDSPNNKAPKFLVPVRLVEKAILLKVLREAGIPAPSFLRTYNRGNLVLPGGWPDEATPRFPNPTTPWEHPHPAHETVRQMFHEGRNWEETAEFQSALRRIKDRPLYRRTEAVSRLQQKGEILQKAYEAIKSNNYKISEDLGRPSWDEPHFFLDKKGEFCGPGFHGNHRFAITRLVGLEMIPMVFGGISFEYFLNQFGSPKHARDAVYDFLLNNVGIKKI